MKKKNRATSALGVILSIILIIVAAATLLTTVLFSKQDTPQLFGYYLYLQKSTAMEVSDDADAAASIHANTVVFAKEYNGTDPLSVNNAILCVLAPDDTSPVEDKDANGYAIRRILSIEPNEETGELLYYPTTMQTDRMGTEPAITSSSILGICDFEHAGLYSYITFVQTLPGILLLLALPCVLLIAMLIAKLVRARNRRLDENSYAFEESYDEVAGEDAYDGEYSEEDYEANAHYQDDYNGPAPAGASPLYSPEISNTSTLDRKRVSIAQNFTPKAVNPNSPYQKARTMQFKAQKDIPILNHAPYDQPHMAPTPAPAPVQSVEDSGYVGRYSAQPEVQEPVETTVPAYDEETNSYVQEPQQPAAPVYRGAHEADGTGSGRLFRSSTSTFKKPNIDDILNNDPLARRAAAPAPKKEEAPAPAPEKKKPAAALASARSKRSGDSSVDDLLAMIENKKKNL